MTELARQSAEAYIDAQKKLLDVATQQLKVNTKTAREAIDAMNPLPAETLGEVARHTVEGFVESQQALLNLVLNAGSLRARRMRPRNIRNPAGSAPAAARRKPVAETA